MTDFSSRVNRTAASELGNIRDEQNEDDNDEFFGGANDSENEEEAVGHGQKITGGIDAVNSENVPSISAAITGGNFPSTTQNFPLQQLQSSSTSGSRRYATNLSKITEVPDESFSFKHGESALRLINEQQEVWREENYLRLPSGTFHSSRYSMKSWEESALRNHCSFVARSELDLSEIQIQSKADKSFAQQEQSQQPADEPTNKSSHEPPIKELRQLNILPAQSQQQTNTSSQMKQLQTLPKPPPSLSETNAGDVRPFISGTRYAVYFGFRRLGVDSEEILSLHNIHPERERVRLRCWLKGSTCFKIIDPTEASILEWDKSLKVFITFLPTAVDHFFDYLYVKCESRHASQKYKFLLHGFGGRAVVRPCMKDRTSSLLLSNNGHFQLVVNSIKKFHFWLENQGNRAAFASVRIYDRKGPLPNDKIMVNTRNVCLDKQQQGDFIKEIKIQCFADLASRRTTPRPSTKPSVPSAAGSSTVNKRQEPLLQIVVFWGEERQRQRLKQFEKFMNAHLSLFGQNFTRFMEFHGESQDWQQQGQGANLEKHVSEEDFYYMHTNMKLIFIDVHEISAFKQRLNEQRYGTAGTSSAHPQQLHRVGTALSVASSSGGTEKRVMLAHQTIVEMEPDDTLVGINMDQEDDTLTL